MSGFFSAILPVFPEIKYLSNNKQEVQLLVPHSWYCNCGVTMIYYRYCPKDEPMNKRAGHEEIFTIFSYMVLAME